MATRMQQRRGTATQWVSTNAGAGPILNAGEIGFESDTNKFKIGDGVNHWDDLTYFVDVDGTSVKTLSGTANQITASSTSGAFTLSLPNAVTFPGSVTLNADPTSSLHAATKAYVDSAIVGIKFNEPVSSASTATLAGTYSNGTSGVGATITGAQEVLVVDGYTLQLNDRILLKNQTQAARNGIYKLSTVGVLDTTEWVLTRATDADNSPTGEIQYGDFCFVLNGTVNAGYGYVMTTSGTITIGTTEIAYTAFNSSKTITAGTGLTESSPGTLAIDTGTTADLSTSQTLSNKTLTSPVISGLTISDASFIIEGTTANEFETTMTFTDPTADRTITIPDATGTVVIADLAQTLSNKTISSGVLTGTLTAGSSTGTNGQFLTSTGTGVQWTSPVGAAAFSELLLVGA
jgi:hypothetical protein